MQLHKNPCEANQNEWNNSRETLEIKKHAQSPVLGKHKTAELHNERNLSSIFHELLKT